MPQTSISAWLNKPKSILEAPQAAQTLPPAPTSNPAPASAQNSPQCLLATLNHANANDVIMPDAPESDSEPPTNAPRKLTLQTPSFGLLPPLPGNVEFVPATAALMPSFRRLNALLLPIPYSPRFYDEILADPVVGNLTVLALWHPAPLPRDSPTTTSLGRDTAAPLPKQTQQNQAVLVGAIRCKLLSTSAAGTPKSASSAGSSNASGLMEPDAPPTLYLSTIVCLSTHRSHGIATHLLREVTRRAAREHGVASVTAHVWAANEEGLNWYARRGFEQVGREEGYYRRLKPGAAVLVRKMVGVADLLEERRESCA